MPYLARASPDRELERLIRLYLKAETDIINEIGRLRSQGLTDYHAVAALERVQAILRSLENDCWEYVPRMVEAQFYVRHPEARAVPGETVEKHLTGYRNAQTLTSTQTDLVQRLTMNLMGQLTEASATVLSGLQSGLIGRVEPDIYRKVGLEQVALQQAVGKGVNQSVPQFIDALRREGVTAFTDKAGRNWSLHTYCTMVSRSTSRQAEILSVLTADPEHDLYRISSHGTTCGLCAPYEGRVYSKSGTDPDFPPLSAAFGKIDPNGPDDLSNSWLNIHPNCLHALLRWSPAGRTPEEIEQIKRFSDPKTNPFTRDPRSEAQIAAYRKKEQSRRKWLEQYRQWEKYRTALGDEVPKTFATFQKHKLAGDEKYQKWVKAFRENNRNITERSFYSGVGSSKVDLRYINSDAYRAKFNSISDNPTLNQAIYKYCKAAITHQSGDYYEDLTILRTDGSLVGQTSSKTRNETQYTKTLSEAVKSEAPYSLVSIHNHGTNVPPSGADFGSAGQKRYAFGIVGCHDGKVYYYSSAHARPFLSSLIDETVDKYLKPPYNLDRVQAAERTLNSISKTHGIEWRELV